MSEHSKRLELPQIIQRPELQGRLRRSALAVVAVVGWAVWLYLFAPLLTLLGWLFGYDRLQAYALNSVEYTSYTVLVYTLLIAAAGAALIAWALYNLLRFRGKDRRRRLDALKPDELARAFGVSTPDTRRLQAAEHAVLAYDEHGQIIRIDTGRTPPPSG